MFTAGTLEAAMYAFDVQTGKQLWKGTLPTSARSTPMTYLGRDGRQYLVISAGGHGVQIGPPLGDYVVAFALPDTESGAQGEVNSPAGGLEGTLERTNTSEPFSNRVPTGENLGHQPPLMIQAEVVAP